MTKIATISAVVIGLVTTSAAQAGSFGKPCTSAPESQWVVY